VSSGEFRGALETLAPEFDVDLSAEAVGRFTRHYELLVAWNRKINLTRITEPVEAARRHFLESAFLTRVVEAPARLVDVGSGAGFPGLVLACLWPEIEAVLVEPSPKRSVFLKEAIRALGLARVAVRAEPFAPSQVDDQTLLTARALDGFRGLLGALVGSTAPIVALFSEPDLLAAAGRAAPDRRARLVPIPGADRRLVGLFERSFHVKQD
jgi:16S rRNA (guanine527-N7)-methyltransferase